MHTAELQCTSYCWEGSPECDILELCSAGAKTQVHQVAKDISGHGNDLPLVTPPARKDMVIDKVRQDKHSQSPSHCMLYNAEHRCNVAALPLRLYILCCNCLPCPSCVTGRVTVRPSAMWLRCTRHSVRIEAFRSSISRFILSIIDVIVACIH